jgi:hypothetical protein
MAVNSMITKIHLQLENVSGVQLRVINTLKKHGLLTIKHAVKDTPENGKLMALKIEGDESINESTISDIANNIAGVHAVVKISRDETVAEAETKAVAEPTEDEKRYRNKDSEAGDIEIRDRMLIFSLLSRYPNISNRLIELKSSFPVEEQQVRLYQLGQGFGQHLIANLKVKDAIHDLESALEKVVVPGLQPLAEFTRVNNLISVSGYSKNLDRGKPDKLLCHFFLGTIEGLLKGNAELPPYRVEKQQCLHQESNCCEYNILPA